MGGRPFSALPYASSVNPLASWGALEPTTPMRARTQASEDVAPRVRQRLALLLRDAGSQFLCVPDNKLLPEVGRVGST